MEFVHLVVLSVIQGLTEFLPVSSSGHLALFPAIFGEKDQGILIDVALHIGTVLFYLVRRKKNLIAPMLNGGESSAAGASRPLWLALVVIAVLSGLLYWGLSLAPPPPPPFL